MDPPVDRKLLDILVCPVTHQPLQRLSADGLAALNQAIARGEIHLPDGSVPASPWTEALVTADQRSAYRVDDGIPVLLAEEALAVAQLPFFAARG